MVFAQARRQGNSHGGAVIATAAGSFLNLVEGPIQRLTEVVDQETAALKARRAVDLSDFNNRKSQGLLELNSALRMLGAGAREPAILERLAALRAKLDVNQAVLKLHLEAVREIAGVIADAIRESESDGTYSQSIRSAGGQYYD